MRLCVVRHGQTALNAQDRICARVDDPLNEIGRKQAEEAGKRLQGIAFACAYCSPLSRARETARIIARYTGVEPVIDERLIEQDYGIFDQGPRKDPVFQKAKRNFVCRYPGGESMFDAAARVYAFLNEIKGKYAEDTVLLVTHGGICRIIRTYFEDMDNEAFAVYSAPNAEPVFYQM